MNKLATILLLVFASYSFAQKVKFKKGFIQIDKKNIVKLEQKRQQDQDLYKVYNKQGELALLVYWNSKTIGNKPNKKYFRWLEFQLPNQEERKEVDPYLGQGFTLNLKTMIARQLVGGFNFVNQEGINQSQIQEFFAQETKSQQKLDYEKAVQSKDSMNAKLKRINLFVDKNGNIYQGGANGTQIGKIIVVESKDTFPTKTRVYRYERTNGSTIATYSTLTGYVEVNKSSYETEKIEYPESDLNFSTEKSNRPRANDFNYIALPQGQILSYLIAEGYLEI